MRQHGAGDEGAVYLPELAYLVYFDIGYGSG